MSSDSLPTSLHARSSASADQPHAHLDVPATGRMILRLLEKLQYGALRLRTPAQPDAPTPPQESAAVQQPVPAFAEAR